MPSHVHRPVESQLYQHLNINHVPIQWLDLVEQDLLRQWAHEQGPNSGKIFGNYGWEFPVFFGERVYGVIWQAFCELLFALNRRWMPDAEGEWGGLAVKAFWDKYRDGDYYWYYDEDDEREYGWVLYTDVESAEGMGGLMRGQVALYKGNTIWRKDKHAIYKAEGPEGGSTEEQAALSGAGEASGSSPTTPVDIPVFPKWNDNIKEKFHRSADRDMEEWDSSLDNWVTETQIALNN